MFHVERRRGIQQEQTAGLNRAFHVEQCGGWAEVPWTWGLGRSPGYFFLAGVAGICLMRTAVSRKILGWDEALSGSGCFPPFQGLERK